MEHYDVIVLGGGSAGTSAAEAASRAGARTAMINDGELGGLCILRGCMPTKSMLAAAHAIHEARNLDVFGARLEGRVVPDFPAIMQRRAGHVRRFKKAKVDSIRAGDYTVIDARGRFVEDGSIRAGDRSLTATSYVIASGSHPTILDIPGIDDVPVLTSDDVMGLEHRPDRVLVQGAGPIGLELAQFFARVGTEVVLVNRSPLLARTDPESGAELAAALSGEIELRVPGTIERLDPRDGGLVARVRAAETVEEFRADFLLMAAGRSAALDGLGLEHVGLEPRRGLLEHDATMRTANRAIWVAGDATGRNQILHVANDEGRVAGFNAARAALSRHSAPAPREVDDRLKMSVVFTDPPFARVGATEAELERGGRSYAVGRARFPETGRAITMETRHGLWKLFAERSSGEILGSTILGPRADDLAHVISTLMLYRGTVEDVLRLPWYHPTLSEVMINLARDLERQLDG